MGYGFAGLRGFGDEEPDFTGLVAQDIAIDEFDIDGGSICLSLRADFEHDGNNWIADAVYIVGYETLKYEGETKTIEKFIPIHDKPEFAGLVAGAEKWADECLMPEDYQ